MPPSGLPARVACTAPSSPTAGRSALRRSRPARFRPALPPPRDRPGDDRRIAALPRAGQPALAASRASAPGGPRGMDRSEAGACPPGPSRSDADCGAETAIAVRTGPRVPDSGPPPARRDAAHRHRYPAGLSPVGRDRRVGTPRTWRSDTVGITDEPASSAQRCLTPANPQTAAAGRSGARIRFRPARRSGRRPPPGGHGSGPGSGRAEPGSGRPPPACGSPP